MHSNDQRPTTEATVESIIAELKRTHWFGSIEVKLEAGLVTLIRKTETIRPDTNRSREHRGINYNDNR